MPLLDDPNALVTYVLQGDRDRADPKPEFVCRANSAKRVREIRAKADAIRDEADNTKAWAMMMDLIESFVVGWRNVAGPDGKPLPFTRDNLDERLQDVELWELVNSAPYASKPDSADAKN